MWIFLTLILFVCTKSESKRNYVFDVAYCNHTHHSKSYFESTRIYTYKDKALSKIYADFTLKQPMPRFNLNFNLDLKRKDNVIVNAFKFKLDGCKFLQVTYNSGLIQIVLKELYRASNFPRKCPVQAGIKYVVDNFTVDPEDYPPIMPTMNFIITLQLWIEQEHIMDVICNGSTKPK